MERPNGKRQLDSLGLKGKYFRSTTLDYVRDRLMALLVTDAAEQGKRFSKTYRLKSSPR